MASQVQWRRGTTAENNAFTGLSGEITVDTDLDELRIHDGILAGGFAVPHRTQGTFTPVLGEAGVTVGDAAYNTGFTVGNWTRIGRVLYYNMTFRITSKGTVTGSSPVSIGGLPLAPPTTVDRGAASIFIHDGVSATNNGSFQGYISNTKTFVQFSVNDISTGTHEPLQMNDITDTLYMQISGHYTV